MSAATATVLPWSASGRAAFKYLREHGYGPEAAAELAGKLEAQPSNIARVSMACLLGWRAHDAIAWLRECGYYGPKRSAS